MFSNKRFQLFLLMLFTLMLVGAGSVYGAEPSGNAFLTNGENRPIDLQMPMDDVDKPALSAQELESIREEALYLADAKESEGGEKKALSPECAAFAKDPFADLGEVLRAGCQPTLAQMSKLMDNPLGNVAMLFTQIDVYDMRNKAFTETSESQTMYTGIAQFPKGISENWNLINRVVWQVVSTPIDEDAFDTVTQYPPQVIPPPGFSAAPIDIFGGRTTGFGDMYYIGLFAPKEAKKLEGNASALWGLGFDAGFPTASSKLTGTGKWTAGPAALGVYMGPKWKVGGLVQQYWDYAEKRDNSEDVNLMNLQYFIYYSITDTFSIGAAPNIIANWDEDSDNKWTVPIGLGFNTTTQFGKVPVRFGVEVIYSVVRPDSIPAPLWDFRIFVIPAIPSALFKWMG